MFLFLTVSTGIYHRFYRQPDKFNTCTYHCFSRNSTHRNQISLLFYLSSFECRLCFEKEAYSENSHVFHCPIKLALFWTVYVLGSSLELTRWTQLNRIILTLLNLIYLTQLDMIILTPLNLIYLTQLDMIILTPLNLIDLTQLNRIILTPLNLIYLTQLDRIILTPLNLIYLTQLDRIILTPLNFIYLTQLNMIILTPLNLIYLTQLQVGSKVCARTVFPLKTFWSSISTSISNTYLFWRGMLRVQHSCSRWLQSGGWTGMAPRRCAGNFCTHR